MKRLLHLSIILASLTGVLRAEDFNRTSLPIPQSPFDGKIGLTPAESTKDFPAEVKAPEEAPNVLIILTDDVGFGASSTFGGPIPTPTFDRLAKSGLRYNQFHTTALCSPTRAALITGRNHHHVSTGVIMEAGVGFPGYNTLVRKSCGTIGQILKYNGYNTAWFGKNHNVPDWQTSQAGPFDLWPTGLGFEYFYGFVGGDTNQWAPALTENTRPIEPPADDPDYNFDEDMADRAIAWMRMQNAVAPDKPFFCYYATGTAHAPHHAPKEWIDKFDGQFDQGWDKVREETLARQKELGVVPQGTRLTERSKGIAAWDSLNDKEKELYARMMEVYAGALSHADHQFGRIIDAIEETGELDNTLIIYIQGDNGASAEGSATGLLNEMTFFNNIEVPFEDVYKRMDELGGPMTFNHYPIGWAHAMDSPFQWTKQVASHFGGTRNGMVISWPKKIKDAGKICSQFHHVIDIAPTILEAAGLPKPESIDGITQEPMDGISLAYTFEDTKAEPKRTTQYFEMFANRAIYDNGWIACTTPPIAPWVSVADPVDVIEGYDWELYNINEDFSESNNVAEENPDKLRELQRLFYIEAVKYDVLPLDNSKVERLDVNNRPSLTRGRDEFTYFEGMTRIPEGSAPDFKNKSFGITAVLEVPEGGAEGLLMTQGGRFSGLGLYVLDGKPVFIYNLADVERYRVEAKEPLEPGKHVVTLDFKYDGGGIGKGGVATLTVDGKEAASEKIPQTIGYRMSLDETLDIGEDTGTPISEDYEVPFKFSGEIEKVTIKITEHELTEEQLRQYRQQQVKAAMSR
ncbi:sulfatase-like hydrolase/transferase [Roseiconus nitratireducens]|uniref:Sulfatase-like hydrolase/transferase n=1 Tax=Roseiconus nitratireducens TaxID=2605748 RepID=A0A5M6D8G8_9BACT|nr:arylsulfatase [Roseiconus nitratireducens]KAA5542780.1 sulfatase-like hydrolase/transferase [Roseiconus nitratireducens]